MRAVAARRRLPRDRRWAVDEVRELRTILIGVSPLLADLIRRSAGARLRRAGLSLAIIAELGDAADLGPVLAQQSPDLIILGGATAPPAPDAFGPVPTLILSTNLASIFGPDADDSLPLTPRSLAARMVELAAAKGLLLS
jgi:hypothetical protein